MSLLINEGKQTLYTIMYFDKQGNMQEGEFLALNLRDANRQAKKIAPRKQIIAVGPAIGVFENEQGIYI
jgi:hypothetical protein